VRGPSPAANARGRIAFTTTCKVLLAALASSR
jgi:hypothetical protein